MRLRTGNKNARRLCRRKVLREAFDFDMRQIARGRDRSNSGYIRRQRKKVKAWVKRIARHITVALDCPSRPWFRLSVPADLPVADREDPAKYLRPEASPFVVDLVRRVCR